MHVDAARHDDHSVRPEHRRIGRKRGDDAAAIDADVAHVTVDPVRRIVDGAAGDAELRHATAPFAASATPSAPSSDAVSRGVGNTARSGSGMSSVRNASPDSWMLATPVSMRMLACTALSLARGPMA